MSVIESYAIFRPHDGRVDEFRSLLDLVIDKVGKNEPGTLRYDWFSNAIGTEYLAIDTYVDEAAMFQHQQNVGKQFAQLLGLVDMELEVLGELSSTADQALTRLGPQRYWFEYGLDQHSASDRFIRDAQAGGSDHIEIYTKFTIEPGKAQTFKSLAAELLDVVKTKDRGTIRYDWFYDADGRQCLALDTYRDVEAMFAHMKNANVAHGKLLEIATVVTEFVGELPAEAQAAVKKYEPEIWTFHRGLKPYSSGGFV